jgi:hypothetical protein
MPVEQADDPVDQFRRLDLFREIARYLRLRLSNQRTLRADGRFELFGSAGH